ncbi:hypothetical protein CLS_12660 [[Clostridium] cf. saccharolyticum K10]|nr:hypothetical protein CLS_12660 [[Clostridium] cf. saccharolyticum K10]
MEKRRKYESCAGSLRAHPVQLSVFCMFFHGILAEC